VKANSKTRIGYQLSSKMFLRNHNATEKKVTRKKNVSPKLENVEKAEKKVANIQKQKQIKGQQRKENNKQQLLKRLRKAAIRGDVLTVNKLLLGAKSIDKLEVFTPTKAGNQRTLLFLASQNYNQELVSSLLNKCEVLPNINKPEGRDAQTALHVACNTFKNGMEWSIIESLLRYGANPTIKDKHRKKPFDYLKQPLRRYIEERVAERKSLRPAMIVACRCPKCCQN
jgi:hypothetical protein